MSFPANKPIQFFFILSFHTLPFCLRIKVIILSTVANFCKNLIVSSVNYRQIRFSSSLSNAFLIWRSHFNFFMRSLMGLQLIVEYLSTLPIKQPYFCLCSKPTNLTDNTYRNYLVPYQEFN